MIFEVTPLEKALDQIMKDQNATLSDIKKTLEIMKCKQEIAKIEKLLNENEISDQVADMLWKNLKKRIKDIENSIERQDR